MIISKCGIMISSFIILIFIAGCNSSNNVEEINKLLLWEANKGDTKEIERLISDGANINTKASGVSESSNNNRNMPINREYRGVYVIHKGEIKKYPDLELKLFKGDTPLLLAIKSRKIEAIKILISKGADYDIVNEMGDTPIRESLLPPIDLNIIKIMITSRKDKCESMHNGKTLYDIVYEIYRGSEESVKLTEYLISLGVDVNQCNSNGIYPIQSAIAKSACLNKYSANMIALLLKCGADVNKSDRNGNTPMHYLALDNRLRGQKMSTGEETVEPFEAQVEPYYYNGKIAELLVANGANINAVNKEHDNPLQLAIRNNIVPVVKVLEPIPAPGKNVNPATKPSGNANKKE